MSDDFKRDRWGRPLIIRTDSKAPVGYTRATTVAETLPDRFGLEKWFQRMVAVGLVERPDLLAMVAAHKDDKEALNDICDDAKAAAKDKERANTGTALHKLTEKADLGEDLGTIPDHLLADVTAYLHATAALTHVAVEAKVVHDGYRIAGTPDRVVEYEGRRYIADLKSGNAVAHPHAPAAQLAIYAHSRYYNLDTYERTDIDADLERGIIIHLQPGTGRCELHWIDIAAGWEAVEHSVWARDWRKRKGLTEPLDIPDPIEDAICNASTEAELYDVYARYAASWLPAHTDSAATRKKAIAAGG